MLQTTKRTQHFAIETIVSTEATNCHVSVTAKTRSIEVEALACGSCDENATIVLYTLLLLCCEELQWLRLRRQPWRCLRELRGKNFDFDYDELALTSLIERWFLWRTLIYPHQKFHDSSMYYECTTRKESSKASRAACSLACMMYEY